MLWEQIVGTVIGGIILAVILGFAGWIWARTRTALGKRPDWTVARQVVGENVRIGRARRQGAYELNWAVLDRENVTLMASDPMDQRDFERDEGFSIPIPQNAHSLLMYWIDNAGRRQAEARWTAESVPASITAIPKPRRRLRWVAR